MKKAVAIFLLVMYGFAATGATIHAHYCMNRLISFSVFTGNANVCSNCGMPKATSHGCCHDEQHHVKTHADHQLAEGNCLIECFSQPAAVTPFIYLSVLSAHAAFAVQAVSNAPPGVLSNKLYLRHNVLLI